jgi:hypothetical protein
MAANGWSPTPAASRQRVHEQQRRGGDRKGGRVDRERRAEPGQAARVAAADVRGAEQRDDRPGERRAHELGELVGTHHERVAGLELLACEQPRQRGLGGRHEEPRDNAEAHRQRVHHPELHGAGEERGRDGGRDEAAQGVGDEHDQPRRVAVGEGAAEQHHRRSGDAGEGEHQAELERIVGERQDEPRQGDQVELVAQVRDGLAQPEQPVVAGLQRSEHHDVTSNGKRGPPSRPRTIASRPNSNSASNPA